MKTNKYYLRARRRNKQHPTAMKVATWIEWTLLAIGLAMFVHECLK